MNISIKRIYEAPAAGDGWRVLVDGMWPRGLTKEDAMLDAWRKDLAPSTGLRKWFAHDPAKWDEFRERYFEELQTSCDRLEEITAKASSGKVTLLFAAKHEQFNNAAALRQFLEEHFNVKPKAGRSTKAAKR